VLARLAPVAPLAVVAVVAASAMRTTVDAKPWRMLIRGVSYSWMQDARSQTYRSARPLSVSSFFASILATLCLFLGCADPAEALKDAQESARNGDYEEQREILRSALESSPDDLPLLMEAARYYLRSPPQGRYKPRLALHYAMRAARASEYPDGEVSKLVFKAYRAAGTLEEERDLLMAGLRAVGHPDAEVPQLRQPVDPDLVEPTLENLREQKRREEGGKPMPPCEQGMAYIPAGRYPTGPESSSREDTIVVQALCIDQVRPGGLASQLESASALSAACAAADKRLCSEDEMLVACGAMMAVLGTHPACVMNRVLRCCGAPNRRTP